MKKYRSSVSSQAGLFRLENLLKMLLLIFTMALGVQLTNGLPQTPGIYEKAILEYVVDGDTIYASVNGARLKIRLLGIDTPESVSETKENTPEGEAASEYVRTLLHSGDELFLEYDEQTFDKYGRTLAYVWLKADADHTSYEDFCKYNLSAVIYQNTWCKLMNIPPNTAYAGWFEDLTPYSGI